MKNLLILTGSYPFEPLDHFVELDLEELCLNYNVSILPQHKSKNSSPHHTKYLSRVSISEGFFTSTTPNANTLLKSILHSLLHPLFLTKLTLSFFYEFLFLTLIDKEQSLAFTVLRKLIKRPRPRTSLKVRFKSLFTTTGFLIYAKYTLRNFNFNEYDLIYSYWGNELALAVSFISNKTLITRLHGYDLYKERRKDMYFAHRNFFLYRLKKIFFISRLGSHYLTQNFPFMRRDKVSLSYIGSAIPNENLLLTPQKKKNLTIVTCSRIHPVKQLHLVAKAVSFVNFPISWHHLGSGNTKDEEAVKSYLKEQNSKNFDVTFHGHIETHEVLSKISSLNADLFINSSKSEGLPISILEAMSLGIPVAAPDVGGIKEAVIDGETGFLLPERITSNRIRETLEIYNTASQEERLRLSANARKLWVEKFRAPVNAKAFCVKLKGL